MAKMKTIKGTYLSPETMKTPEPWLLRNQKGDVSMLRSVEQNH